MKPSRLPAMIALAGAALLLAGAVHYHATAHHFEREMAAPGRSVRRGTPWSALHRPEPGAPTGAAAIGSAGAARASFVDVAEEAGLRYRWTVPGPRPLDILQTIGNGCAFLDYDNSGDLSVLLVGTDHVALFKGDGRGHFTDVSHLMGLDSLKGHFLGCAVGDYDNDGYDDIYLSGYRTGLLLHNEKGKSFRDVTARAGLKPQPWGTSCAWGDIDGDGRLDLFVCGYVKFDPADPHRLCNDGRMDGTCSPMMYPPEQGVLYHNEGQGRFRDVSAEWRVQSIGKNLGVAFADYDGSGRQSFYLANDTRPGEEFHNAGGRFIDLARRSGSAYDGHGKIHSGMGLDWGDYDNDGRLDLTVMAFQGEPKCVYHNAGAGLFEEVSDPLALTGRTAGNVAFGVKWLDYDNDGWLDLMITNGAVRDNIAQADPSTRYRQATQLFRNDHGRLFVDMSGRAGTDLSRPLVGRGLAVGDFDNDGREDALVVDSEGAPLLLRNESAPTGHWLSLSLVGTRSNRDGYGARVTAETPGLVQTRLCHADGSYLSSSDKRVHIGLGGATSVQTLRVRWPSGHTDTFRNVLADRFLRLREGGRLVDFQGRIDSVRKGHFPASAGPGVCAGSGCGHVPPHGRRGGTEQCGRRRGLGPRRLLGKGAARQAPSDAGRAGSTG